MSGNKHSIVFTFFILHSFTFHSVSIYAATLQNNMIQLIYIPKIQEISLDSKIQSPYQITLMKVVEEEKTWYQLPRWKIMVQNFYFLFLCYRKPWPVHRFFLIQCFLQTEPVYSLVPGFAAELTSLVWF